MALVSIGDYERKASELIPTFALDYYKSGAGDEVSLKLNSSCFNRIRIRPRCLMGVGDRDTSCNVLGIDYTIPLGVSPTAMQKLAHPDGEKANAMAAETTGIGFILSTIATSSIEEVAKACPNSPKWFQLYIYTDRDLTKQLVRRAERNGFKAIVLTIDTPMFGLRRADLRNKFTLPPHLSMANFDGDNATGVKSQGGSGINEYVAGKFDNSLTWDDVRWLMSLTNLPVIVKGVLTREDAIIAADVGVQGILVSNHGARQLDTVPATIEALPEIVEAVGHRVTVMLDGGVTQGTDIFKALALGAKMVFIGRPPLWGLAVDGQKGVERVIDILKYEFDIAMAMAGCRTIADINREHVVHEYYYAKL